MQPKKGYQIIVEEIGQPALEIIRRTDCARIVGFTSQGVFLKTDPGEVLFLSANSWRGPLTVNLPQSINDHIKMEIGDTVILNFPFLNYSNLSIKIPKSLTGWKPEAVQFDPEKPDDMPKRAGDLSHQLMMVAGSSTFIELLQVASNIGRNTEERHARIRAWLFEHDESKAKDFTLAFSRFIGFGAGLTPAGDDFIIGFLLTSFYLQSGNKKEIQALLKEARAKTTALSASLMECAAEGSADERLMDALRFIAEGKQEPQAIKKELLSYGSSSGIETLAGMVTAIYLNLVI